MSIDNPYENEEEQKNANAVYNPEGQTNARNPTTVLGNERFKANIVSE